MKKIFKIFYGFIFYFIFLTSTSFAFPASSNTIFYGIDISKWQGNIDFSKVAKDGIEVVYIKASEGTTYINPYLRKSYKEAKENGLKVGFYHYVRARSINYAKKEAKFFVSTIKNFPPDCKLAMDFEQFGNLTKFKINEISKIFLEEVKKLSNKDVIIYSNASNAKNTFSKELAKNYPIWVAEYYVSEPKNGNWKFWEGFQYTDKGKVSGIKGFVDRDYFTENILLSTISNSPSPIPTTDKTDSKNFKNVNYIIVQPGNTLIQIAKQYNTTYTYLAKINNIKNPNLIYVGQKIYVPSNNNSNYILYIIKPGDTLTSISKKFKVSIDSLISLNNIKNPNIIYAGEILKIK